MTICTEMTAMQCPSDPSCWMSMSFFLFFYRWTAAHLWSLPTRLASAQTHCIGLIMHVFVEEVHVRSNTLVHPPPLADSWTSHWTGFGSVYVKNEFCYEHTPLELNQLLVGCPMSKATTYSCPHIEHASVRVHFAHSFVHFKHVTKCMCAHKTHMHTHTDTIIETAGTMIIYCLSTQLILQLHYL